MSGYLIVHNKNTGVCPFGIGETWRYLFANCMLKATVSKSTNACQDDKICVGLKAGIYVALHVVKAIWDANSSTENWGFLLVNAKTRSTK